MLSSFLRSFAKQQQQLPRTHISMVGFMNAGKSTLMNAITQQQTSIVDNTPGTTADTKISLMEIHSLGPCKLIDTAGIDESGILGQKKLTKTISAVKESDVVLLVVDPTNYRPEPFKEVASLATRRGKSLALVLNKFNTKEEQFEKARVNAAKSIQSIIGKEIPTITISGIEQKETNKKIIPFIASLIEKKKPVPVLPPKFVGPDKTIFLNIPLDIESPTGRLLRPQTLAIEYSLRRQSSVFCFNMDLKKARGTSVEREEEKKRFSSQLSAVKPSLVVTDSQAIDVAGSWVPNAVPLTTFSVAMANFQSGSLKPFIRGIDALSRLKAGDRVLICEACNHDRIGDDIGTVQLPTKLRKTIPGVEIEWAFGRAYEGMDLSRFSLVLHCGGCLISKQQMQARLQDLFESGVPVANYGLALSWLASPDVFGRVLEPWK